MAVIKELKTADGNNEIFYPVTDEKSVYDDDGVCLADKLKKAEYNIYSITLAASSWSTAAPYTQSVTVNGVSEKWIPMSPLLISSNNMETDTLAKKN